MSASDMQDRVRLGLVTGVAATALAVACCSLSWRMVHDVPVMLYQANLMAAHGLVPYRDFFCINMPGALWMYEAVIRCFGISDVSVHLANALIVAAVVAFSILASARGCWYCGLFGASLGVLRIYAGESAFILQRELMALVPIMALTYVGLKRPLPGRGNECLEGLLLAWLFLIKPHFVLFGAGAFVLLWVDGKAAGDRLFTCALLGLAFLLPVAACGAWLVSSGAWPRFQETLTYWTLYGQMSQAFTFLGPADRARMIALHVLKMLFSPYTAVAAAALYLAWLQKAASRRTLLFLGAMMAAALVAPALSGQFWGYHRLPFFFFTLYLAGHLLVQGRLGTWLAVGLALFWVPFASARVYRETTASSVERLKHGVPDAFERYLRCHLEPGERVQPMDWTCGALQGMLLTDMLPATRYLEYSYFLHSVSHPLIQRFRDDFMDGLERRPPRLILEALAQSWPNGADTEAHFERFEAWRSSRYQVAESNAYYRIWALTDPRGQR